jgi:hypothetical protein
LQEYFVYFKKKWQNQSAVFPEDAAGVLCGVALRKKWKPLGRNPQGLVPADSSCSRTVCAHFSRAALIR